MKKMTKTMKTPKPQKFPIEYMQHEGTDSTIELWGLRQLIRKASVALPESGKSWAHVLVQIDDHTLAMALIREVTRGCYGATLAYTRFGGDAQLLEASKALIAEAKSWAKDSRADSRRYGLSRCTR